jgi:DNA repair exonuclease SbcCD ATPase subunit
METGNQQSDKRFENFGKRVDQFMGELDEATVRLQKEFSERFEELKVSAEKLKNEAESSERWKEVEASLKRASEELAKAVKAAFKKKDVPPSA